MPDPADDGRWRTADRWLLSGLALLAVSTVLPVMRWQANAAHATAGSARVFLGRGWTLFDGGFPLRVAVAVGLASAAILAVVVLARRVDGRPRPVTRTVLGVGVAAYPAWVAAVFVKKLEDDVDPAEGAAALVISVVLIARGLWVGRPR